MHIRWSSLGVAFSLLLVSCGSAADTAAVTPAGQTAAVTTSVATDTAGAAGNTTLPACAGAKTTAARPSDAEFPAGFPLGPGTVITKAEPRSGNRMVIESVMPMPWATALDYLNAAIPGAGFTMSGGESEPNLEAESNYAGQGFRGRWVLHTIANCPDASTLTVLAGK